MRKFLIIACAITALNANASNEANESSSLLSTPTYTHVSRRNGGLFGYKTVSESIGEFNAVLGCADPGKLECKFKGKLPNPNISVANVDDVDKEVSTRVNARQLSGQFVYKTDFLVVYSYNVDNDTTVYDIFTRDEATERGYSF